MTTGMKKQPKRKPKHKKTSSATILAWMGLSFVKTSCIRRMSELERA